MSEKELGSFEESKFKVLKPTSWASDKSRLKDLETILSFIVAYFIAIVLGGLFEGFSLDLIVQLETTLMALGLFFGRHIIIRLGVKRGKEAGEEDKEHQELVKENHEKIKKLHPKKSGEAIRILNERKRSQLRYDEFKRIEGNLEQQINNIEPQIKFYEDETIKFLNFRKKKKLKKLKKTLRILKLKKENLDENKISVKYEQVTIDDLKFSSEESKNNETEKQQMNVNVERESKRMLLIGNVFQTAFMVIYHLAIFISIFERPLRLMFWIGFLTISYFYSLNFAFGVAYRKTMNKEKKALRTKNEWLDNIIQTQSEIREDTVENKVVAYE